MNDKTHAPPSGRPASFDPFGMVGESPPFRRAQTLLGRCAACDATVLLQGETGTGKESAARLVHYLGARRDGPFVPVNCGALPDTLIESELYGHERGAFTDARSASPGLVSQAAGGTLFLDEVEALSPRGQVVLLRFLQDRQYRAVGSTRTRVADVRIVAATNVDLGALCERGAFRKDLIFRLSVLTVELPPLRQRTGDVERLAEHFLQRFAEQYDRPPRALSPASLAFLRQHLLHRAVLLSDGPLVELEDPPPDAPPRAETFRQAKAQAVAAFERAYVRAMLMRAKGSITQAARLARKDRSAFGKLVRKYELHALIDRDPH
jgi:DNA-binding NtrC family response regulator